MVLRGLTDLIFIRHGESLRNIMESNGPFYQNNADRETVGISQDRLIPLTEKGRQQARKTGAGLKKEFGTPRALVHSGFLRTVETADGILKAYSGKEQAHLTIEENHLIRERNPGYLMNCTEREVQDRLYWWQDYWRSSDKFSAIPIGGESIASMAEGRLLVFLKLLESDFYRKGDNKIFIVSHGRAILGMRYLLEEWSYERVNQALAEENPPNCSATHYTFDAYGRPHLQSANRNLFPQ